MFPIFTVIVSGTVLDSGILDRATADALAARFGGGMVLTEWVSVTDSARCDRLSADIMRANRAENFVLN